MARAPRASSSSGTTQRPSSRRICGRISTSSDSIRAASARARRVECFSGPELDALYQLDPTPETEAERQAVIDATEAFDKACEAHSGKLLPHMTTADAARDMDQIRAALGEPKLTYLGFSYGTFLGTVYAGLFPTHVRALVLDGAVDPTLSSDEQGITQAAGFQQALDSFLADCASNRKCSFYNGGQPGPAFDALMKKIDAEPLPASALNDPRPVGLWLAITGVAAALYSRQGWGYLAQALALAQNGDGSILLLLADQYYERQPDGTYNNLFSVFWAVGCTDYVNSPDVAHYESLIPEYEKVAPHVRRSVRLSEPQLRVLAGPGRRRIRASSRPRAPRRSSSSAPPATRRRRTSGRSTSRSSSAPACC